MVPDIPIPMNNKLGAMSGIAMCTERVLALNRNTNIRRYARLLRAFGVRYLQNIHLGSR